MAAIPTLCIPMEEGTSCNDGQFFFKEEGQVLSYLYVMVKSISTLEGTKHMVDVYMLQNGDDAWRRHLTLAVDYIIHA
jgi:hypothetical protein